MIASIHELFKAFSGGQFEPVYTGQFKPVSGGQFKSVWGGQFHRFLHSILPLKFFSSRNVQITNKPAISANMLLWDGLLKHDFSYVNCVSLWVNNVNKIKSVSSPRCQVQIITLLSNTCLKYLLTERIFNFQLITIHD